MVRRRTYLLCLATTVLCLVSACSSAAKGGATSSKDSGSTPAASGSIAAASGSTPAASGSATSAGGGSDLATATASLAKYYKGTDRSLPTSAPKPPAGKKIWVIACSTNAEGCSTPANAAADAGRKLGWTVTVQDGKLDPNVYNQLIRGAIAAKVDGIVLESVDCGPVAAAIKQATAAGIKVVGSVASDCNVKYVGGQPEFTAQVSYCAQPTSDEAKLEGCYESFLNNEYAGNMANYTIVKANGKANVIVMQEDDTLQARIVGTAYQSALAKCSGCEVHVVPFTGQDLIDGGLQAKAAAAIQKYPAANTVMIPYDAAGLLGVSAAVKAAQAQGRALQMIGAEGLSAAIAQIKSGQGQTFATGAPIQWWGWSAIDAMIRVFAGQPQVDQGIGVQAIDKDHNLPTKTPYYNGNQHTDWQANYLKIWGVSS